MVRYLEKETVICLLGELGTGKTTFTQGIARGLKIKQKIKSPTFKLINEYKGKIPFYHLDLYRLDSIEQLEDIGYREYIYSSGITVIEWAEKMGTLLPEKRIEVHFFWDGPNKRRLIIDFY